MSESCGARLTASFIFVMSDVVKMLGVNRGQNFRKGGRMSRDMGHLIWLPDLGSNQGPND
jgi:hypothetical protein